MLIDPEKLTMSFMKDGEVVQPLGDPKPGLEEASLHQLRRLVTTHALDTCLQLHLLPSPTPNPATNTTNTTPPPRWLATLLSAYSNLFSEPTHLLPPRLTNHVIPLLCGSNPVNVRPYRYRHFQK